ITNGKIEPASIEAGVLADQAGPDYNLGPIAKLTIPGFKGSPKYEGFYGELKEGTKDGFIGQKAVPTADDIQKAKDKAAEILRTTLESNLLANYPPDFKILDGVTSFNITKLNVNENTDASGNFSVFGEANIMTLGFREADLKSFLGTLAAKDNPTMVFKELNLTYSEVRADFKNKTESFMLVARGALIPEFSVDDFRGKILGQKVQDARILISSLKGLADARISLWPRWPIWSGRVPADVNKIKVLVN
ncbi:MAG: hypothetical protein Q7R94_03160, partial [bacterium]|nr:hypothetical protein [bacterium]